MVLRLPDPVLVVLVGPSASGKTHWAAENFRDEQIVSSDQLRAVVGESAGDLSASADAFTVLELIVRARTSRRLTTVVDTLGMDPARRQAWRELAENHEMSCIAVVFDTPAAECRRRNAARPDVQRVSQGVLTAQLASYRKTRPILAGEGFERVLAPEPVRVVPAAFAVPRSGSDSGTDSEGGTSARQPPEPQAGDGPAPAPAGRLRFGLQISRFDVPGGARELGERLASAATRAEAAGFDSIWVMDHFRQIPQVGRAWEDIPESTVTLGYLAAATRTATIGCLVNGIGYRNVAHLGKIVATLDVLSGGRARCGLGAGWFKAEYEGYGWDFEPPRQRLDLLEDALRLLPVLWGPGSAAFTGTRISAPDTMCYPRPIQQRIPILVGGSGEKRTLKLVARYADACNLTGDVQIVRRKLEILQRHCAAAGRDPAEVEVTHLSTVLAAPSVSDLAAEVDRRQPPRGRSQWAAQVNPGTTADHVLRARHLQDAGVQHLIVSLPGIWDSPAVERFGEVIDQCAPR